MNGIELVASWFTPTVLFCVLNLVIGTIFITSTVKPPQNQRQDGQSEGEFPRQLGRVPSILERVKSINLSRYRADQPDGEHTPQLGRVPSFLERVNKSINLSRHRSEHPEPADEQPVQQQESKQHHEESHHVTRIKSAAVEKAKPAAKMLKKSASEKVVANKREDEDEDEKEVDQRRPATVRERTAASRGDEAVDKKADDFINRFRQQLKLQRLDSILRYTEMLNRGAAR